MAREKMTREELTREIAKRVKDIRELYYSVYPKGDYMDISFRKENVSFVNSCWEGAKDEDFPIDYHENEIFIRMNKNREFK